MTIERQQQIKDVLDDYVKRTKKAPYYCGLNLKPGEIKQCGCMGCINPYLYKINCDREEYKQYLNESIESLYNL